MVADEWGSLSVGLCSACVALRLRPVCRALFERRNDGVLPIDLCLLNGSGSV